MDEDVTIDEVMGEYIRYSLEGMYTSIPGIVLAIKGEGQNLLIDVQPLVSVLMNDGTSVSRAPILNVPLQMPASSRGGLLFPVAVKDNVMLLFSMRGLEVWKYGQGTPNPPSDARMFDKRDCIAIPCVNPVSKSPANSGRHTNPYSPEDVVLYHNLGTGQEVEIVLKTNGGIIINAPGNVTVNTPDAYVNGNLHVSQSIFAPSMVVAGKELAEHRHGGVEPGGGTTSPNI